MLMSLHEKLYELTYPFETGQSGIGTLNDSPTYLLYSAAKVLNWTLTAIIIDISTLNNALRQILSLSIIKFAAGLSSLAVDRFIKRNAWEPYSLPIPRSEALELPIGVEWANSQRPHAEYDIPQIPMLTHWNRFEYTYPHKPSTICHILDSNWNFPDFRTSRKSVKYTLPLCLWQAMWPAYYCRPPT